jgi:cytochrome c553
MDEAAHVAALKGYASGEKEDESGMMAMYAEELSEQDMADVAAYYAGLK